MKTLAILAVAFVFLTPAADAHHGGEPHPKGYGKNPCVTKVHDMAVSSTVYSEGDFDWELNFIGCDYDQRIRGANRCERLAYDVAADWLRNGQPILNLTVDKMGRALDSRSIHGGVKRFACTLEEDLSWSYETGD